MPPTACASASTKRSRAPAPSARNPDVIDELLLGALGVTLNVLTLMALSRSIGILIDDAIVVVENIVRHRELGKDHFEAAGRGTHEIILAVILIFLIVASQFESFTQPAAIMLSLPLSLMGVLLALLLTRSTLNIMSMIGVIMLMGLVTKNAILLVDNANERRRAGTHRFTALIEAGSVRLRPIMMTTLAMIAGMLPIALALGEGGEFRAPMARAVIGGLITSTMLTLIVVPVAYSYFDDFGNWVTHRFVNEKREDELSEEMRTTGTHHALTGERPKRERWKKEE